VASRILSLARGGVVTFMVLGLFWGVSAASAQEARGALVGRVSDSTGAVIPGKTRRTAPYKCCCQRLVSLRRATSTSRSREKTEHETRNRD